MVAEESGDYHMTAHKATVKYEQLCRYAMESQETVKVTRYGNRLYTIRLSCVPVSYTHLDVYKRQADVRLVSATS